MAQNRAFSVLLNLRDNFSGNFANAMSRASESLGRFSQQIESAKLTQGLSNIGKAGAAAALAVGGALAVPIKQAMEFETAMSEVKKAVNDLDDPKLFAEMNRTILEMGRTMPLAHEAIADIMAAGGRMGIKREDLQSFATDVAKMSVAFDMSAGEVGDAMGKLANVFGIPIKKIGELGAAINHLEDNNPAKAAQVIDALSRVGGTANQVGLTAENTTALVTSFIAMGKTAETAASASNALMRELALAPTMGKDYQKALAQIGLNSAKVAKGMATDAQGTIMQVMQGLQKVPKEMQVIVATKLFGKEFGDDAALLSNGLATYTKNLEHLKDAELKGSLDKAYQTKLETTAAKFQMLKNSANEVMIELGTALLPIVIEIMEAIKPLVLRVTDWVKENKSSVVWGAKLAGKLALVAAAVSAVSFGVGGLITVITKLTTGVSLAFKAITFVTNGIRLLGFVLSANPIGAIIAGIALGAFVIYRNWDGIVAWFKDKFSFLENVFSDFGGFVSNNFVNIMRRAGYLVWDVFFFPLTAGIEMIQAALNALGMDIKIPNLSAKNLFGDIDWKMNPNTKPFELSPSVASMPSMKAISMFKPKQDTYQVTYSPIINVSGGTTPDQIKQIERASEKGGTSLLNQLQRQQELENRKKYD